MFEREGVRERRELSDERQIEGWWLPSEEERTSVGQDWTRGFELQGEERATSRS